MQKGTAFIQPHSDDAVMSMYYTIKSGYLPKPYYLITAFSESDWVDPIQRVFLKESYTELSQEKITEIRELEDKEFANFCDMKPIFLKMPDSKIRLGQAIFDPNTALDPEVIAELNYKLSKTLSEINIGTIVFPCPNGERQHIDHRILFEVCIKMQDYNKYLSDDFPYGIIEDVKLYNIVQSIHTNSILEKFKVMSLYKSQMNSYFYEDVLNLHTKNGNTERLLQL